LKRAVTIVGRFAFGGWAIVSGILLLFSCVAGLRQGFSAILDNPFYSVFILLLYGLAGAVGGGVVGLLAAVLERLFKRPTRDPRIEADVGDPSVWPPAPKPPQ
jgi:hypothetical protein